MSIPSQPIDKTSFLSKIPSIAWVILLPLGLAVVIGSIIATFFGIAMIEGLASMIFLVIGYFCFRGLSNPNGESINSFILALSIVFFALMGMSVDQPGNFIYNKPLEIFFCPPQTTLYRGVDTYNPLPGRTDIVQNFACYDADKNMLKELGMFEVIGTRFGEYVLIGYLLFYFNKFTQKKKS